jgi:hypothetical protein
VGPRDVLDAVLKRKIPSPRRESNRRTPIVKKPQVSTVFQCIFFSYNSMYPDKFSKLFHFCNSCLFLVLSSHVRVSVSYINYGLIYVSYGLKYMILDFGVTSVIPETYLKQFL